MGMVRIFKCVWKKPLMLIYMVNWCATTKIWMYNWVLQTQEMLVVKQVLGIAKKFACPRQRAEQRADLIFCTLVNVMLFLHAIGPGLSVGLFDNVKKKNLQCTWEGQCLWCLSGPARNHTEFIPTGNRISYLSAFTLLKTQGDWQGHIWDVNKLQHKHQLSLSGMASLTACRNHIDVPVCAQITVLFNIPREILQCQYYINI